MKIAILGTRGIPNQYGGFEQLAEYLSIGLLNKGHQVTVYNSSLHPYKNNDYCGVRIVHCYDPENKMGTAGQFIYDLNCIWHSRKENFDLILQLGYTSSSVWSFLFPGRSRILTNMDGLEWKRSKYGKLTRYFLKHAEKWAVLYSDALIADSPGIRDYLLEKYNKQSTYIPYGASIPVINGTEALTERKLSPYSYYMLLARMEPENNIETILDAYTQSGSEIPFLVIGNTGNSFGSYLKNKFAHTGIIFSEAEYNMQKLNQLRKHALIYFHGHSVGGTNPSLLEAMASEALICAHRNIFNEHVLGKDALWFSNTAELLEIFHGSLSNDFRKNAVQNNIQKITKYYTWESVYEQYSDAMIQVCKS